MGRLGSGGSWRPTKDARGFGQDVLVRFHAPATPVPLCSSPGAYPKVVSEMLGHANVSITLDTYGHVIPGMGDAAVSAMDDALKDPDDDALDES